jgi:hypothetical protein
MTAISIARFAESKVAEEWELMDQLGMMQQLGVVSRARPKGNPIAGWTKIQVYSWCMI